MVTHTASSTVENAIVVVVIGVGGGVRSLLVHKRQLAVDARNQGRVLRRSTAACASSSAVNLTMGTERRVLHSDQ